MISECGDEKTLDLKVHISQRHIWIINQKAIIISTFYGCYNQMLYPY